MKTSLKMNNKFWTVALAVIVSISCILGLWTVVYAQEQKSEAPTKNILRLVVKKSPTGESTHYFFFVLR